ncbi:MAG: GNAT family N-acetyltransferase [Coriobacteriia bacterium]|nr:GNAT family N-acetyltransferase [Coriobacteriia bacterium]
MNDEVDVPYPHYLCPVDGKELPLAEARMSVTCAEHQPRSTEIEFAVREATHEDRHAIEEICDRAWGETEIDVFGRTFDVLSCENLIAVAGDELAGLISLAVHGGELAIVMYSVYPQYQGRGIGSALLKAASALAIGKGLVAMKTAVSNDDLPLLYFYQRHGFVIAEIATGLLADRLGYAGVGFAGIPIRDEIRLRRPVCG